MSLFVELTDEEKKNTPFSRAMGVAAALCKRFNAEPAREQVIYVAGKSGPVGRKKPEAFKNVEGGSKADMGDAMAVFHGDKYIPAALVKNRMWVSCISGITGVRSYPTETGSYSHEDRYTDYGWRSSEIIIKEDDKVEFNWVNDEATVTICEQLDGEYHANAPPYPNRGYYESVTTPSSEEIILKNGIKFLNNPDHNNKLYSNIFDGLGSSCEIRIPTLRLNMHVSQDKQGVAGGVYTCGECEGDPVLWGGGNDVTGIVDAFSPTPFVYNLFKCLSEEDKKGVKSLFIYLAPISSSFTSGGFVDHTGNVFEDVSCGILDWMGANFDEFVAYADITHCHNYSCSYSFPGNPQAGSLCHLITGEYSDIFQYAFGINAQINSNYNNTCCYTASVTGEVTVPFLILTDAVVPEIGEIGTETSLGTSR